MAILMPVEPLIPSYTFEIELELVTYVFAFRWNDRDSAWFFSISLLDGTPLLDGRKVVVGFPLLARFRDNRLPAGDLNAVDTTGQNVEATFEDFGTRVKLLYFPSTEL